VGAAALGAVAALGGSSTEATITAVANLLGPAMNAKQSAFWLYGSYDYKTCSSADACLGSSYPTGLQAEYTVGRQTNGVVAFAGANQTLGSGATVRPT
jgi:hypothetical protein